MRSLYAPYSGNDGLQGPPSCSTLVHPFPWTLHWSPCVWRSPRRPRPEYIKHLIICKETQNFAYLDFRAKEGQCESFLSYICKRIFNSVPKNLRNRNHIGSFKKIRTSNMKITCSTISCAIRFLENPPFPVAQNEQRKGQPTWLTRGKQTKKRVTCELQ